MSIKNINQTNQFREHFNVHEMHNFAVEVLKKAGYPDDSAKATAYALLDADTKGIFSHGIAGGTGLEESVKRTGITATVDPQAKPKVIPQKYPTIIVIDAQGSPGHISSMIAVDLAKKTARKYGMSKVYVKNANHFGAAGTWSDLIAKEKDLEGIVNCTTAACAPVMGDDPEGLDYTKGMGKKIRMGTDPISYSIPHKDGIVTLDMATTRLAASYCVKCFKSGEKMKIPSYAFNKEGKSTFNPKEVFTIANNGIESIGGFFPLGSEAAGYKGGYLGIVGVEMDHSLGGGPIQKTPWKSLGSKRRISHAFQAQAIDFLYTKEQSLKRVKEFMQDYETYFGSSSRWPGERSKKAIEYTTQNGIPYSQSQIDTLRRTAEQVGLNFDEMTKSKGKKNFPAEIFKK
jgi:L-2-hydroxycarboxylate dehydrogenase (NAD+)